MGLRYVGPGLGAGLLAGLVLLQPVIRLAPVAVWPFIPVLLLLAGLWVLLPGRIEMDVERGQPRPELVRPPWLLATAGVAAAIVLVMLSRSSAEPLWDVAILWVAAMGLLLVGAGLPSRWRALSEPGGRAPEVAAVVVLVAIAAVLRIAGLETVPVHLHGEEGEFGFIARDTLIGRPAHPFGVGWYTHPVLPFFFQGLAMAIFGDTIFGLRFFSALGGVAGVLATFFWARYLYTPLIALGAACLLATFHLHVYFSRTALQVGQSWLSMFLPLVLLLVYFGVRRQALWAFALAGLLAGLAQFWYFSGRTIPVIALVVLAHTGWALGASWRMLGRALVVLAVGVVVGMLPLLVQYGRAPGTYLDRVHGVFTDTPDSLTAVAREAGVSLLEVLPGYVMQTVLAFHRVPSQDPFYQTQLPLLDPMGGALVLVGLVACLKRWKDGRYFGPLAAAGLILGAVALTEFPPQAQRLAIISAPLMVLLTLGVVEAARLLGGSMSTRLGTRGIAMVIGLLAGINVWMLFGDYLPSGRDAVENSEVASELGYYLRAEGRPVTYYFFGEPRMTASSHQSTRFIARAAEGINVPEPPSLAPEYRVDPNRTLFIFLAERLGDLEPIRAQFPGPPAEAHRNGRGEAVFFVFRPSSSS